jgi:hypothetical protein
MTKLAKWLATALAAGGVAAAPAAAQYQPYPTYPQTYPPQTYPQPYPQQGYPQPYPQQSYPYPGQPYGGNVIEEVIGGLLGNQYNATDRQAVAQCASAAMAQARNEYQGGYHGYPQGYAQPYQNGQGFAPPAMRVTAITEVTRKSFGLRVKGLIDSGYYGPNGYNGPNGQYQYQNQGYPVGDLKFRCTVDYRGYVTSVRVDRNEDYRRY